MSLATERIRIQCTARAHVPTPLGPLLLARTAQGLAGAWFEHQKHHPGDIAAPERPDDALLAQAAAELLDHFAGGRTTFGVPLDLHGSDFQRAVWRALLDIAPGETCSYGALARRLGQPAAVRAVGGAVGRNPVSVIVPCHRVVGSGGSLTGYAGGTERKRALLRLEGAWPAEAARPLQASLAWRDDDASAAAATAPAEGHGAVPARAPAIVAA